MVGASTSNHMFIASGDGRFNYESGIETRLGLGLH